MIQDQINAIGDALAWIKKHKPEQYDQRFQQLVQERLKLRKIQAALREHPAIAAYGESQKGKSHVMNNLLLKDGEPYKVETPNGPVDFIAHINPIGKDVEATGVVTRFTSFELPDGSISPRYHAEHPVLIKLLSVTDVVCMIVDSYFNDVVNPPISEKEEMNAYAQAIQDKYEGYPEQYEHPVTEDDIYEVWNYVRNHVPFSGSLSGSNFFITLARYIRQIPFSDLPMIFSHLWHETMELTELFARLINTVQRLSFSQEVYSNIEVVRNNQNTIMGVACLVGLSPEKWSELSEIERYATLFVFDAKGVEHREEKVPKCELAAVTAEVQLKIDASNLETDIQYDLSSIPNQTLSQINRNGFRKNFLHQNDLLDFPGARNRRQESIRELPVKDLITRGKVSYLFHKYSEGHIFNILLFCQDYIKMEVHTLWILLSKWVQTYVGRTPEERARMIRRTEVAPIFFVGTKFNRDMEENLADPESNSDTSLTKRWQDRFETVLWNDAVNGGTADPDTNDRWFINWLSMDGSRPFDNCYILRDFKYSSDLVGSHLFKGYNPLVKGSREETMLLTPDFYTRMRESFIKSNAVRRFISNPELAWDVTATINNDGSQYLLERLSIVAKNISNARHEQLVEKQNEIIHRVQDILKDYYVDEDADKLLKANVKKAKKVMREMDFCIQSDNYFFGHMIECLQTTERETYTVLHKLVQGTELNQKTTDFGNVSLVLKRYGKQLEACKNDEERWAVLQEELVMDSRQEVEEYLSRKGIDPTTIFAPSTKKHQNSVIIADKTFDAWEGKLRSPSLLGELSNSEEFDSVVMGHLIDNIIETAKQMQLSERIAALIAEYVNVLVTTTINESLVADLMATEINNFVNTLGYAYREAAEVNKLKELAEELNLTCFEHIGVPRQESFSEEELTKMFDDFNENENTLTPSFALNYELWIEYMMISFIGKNAVGDYDREANRQMGEIIKMIK